MNARAVAHPYSKSRLDQLVREIEEAIVGGNRAVQSQLVLRSANLLVKHWSCLSVSDKPAFDALLYGLSGEVDADARRAFATELAELRRGPPRTSDRLARDSDASVAASILERCRSLEPAQLADIALTMSEGHRQAIACRRPIDANLTELLLAQGGPGVALGLLENPDATIACAGIAQLVRHAVSCERVALRLVAHPLLGESDLAKLVALARQRAQAALQSEYFGDTGAVPSLLGPISQAGDPAGPERAARFAASVAYVTERFAAEPPQPALMMRWLALNRIEDVLAALAHHAGLPIERVVAAFDASSGTMLCLILHGAGWSWSILKVLFEMKHATEVLPEILMDNYALMTNMSPLCARRLVRLGHAPARIGAFLGGRDCAWPELAPSLESTPSRIRLA